MKSEWVLIVGDNSAVVETRAQILAPLITVKATSSDAMETLLGQPCGVVIIGHTVPTDIAEEFVRTARILTVPPAIITIRFPGEERKCDVENHETNSWSSPGWIKVRVLELLDERQTRHTG